MIRRNGTALVVSAVVLVGVTWFAVAQAADQNPAGAVGGAGTARPDRQTRGPRRSA